MGKVIVKLKDQTSVFHDTQQPNVSLTGKAVVEMEKSEKVAKGLKHGAIEKATQEELDAWEKYQAELKQKEAKNPGKEVAEVVVPPAPETAEKQPNLPAPVDYTKWDYKKLSKELESRNVEVKDDWTKEDLIAMLQADDEDKAKGASQQ